MRYTSWLLPSLALLTSCNPCCNSAPNRPAYCKAIPPDPNPNARAAGHDHPASCWIGSEQPKDDAEVDMMLFVIGLNHRTGIYEQVNVDLDGVRRLSDAIVAACPHGENVVIVGSAFSRFCTPSTGACLKSELEQRYGTQFYLREVDDSVATPAKYGTKGVLSGSRWYPEEIERFVPVDPERAVARVFLRDRVTGFGVDVHAMHTKENEGSRDEIGPTAAAAKAHFRAGSLTPILAGDFNFHLKEPDPGIYGAELAAQFVRANFTWVNENVPCPGVSGLPDGLFRIQNGYLMHAFVGRYSVKDPSYSYSCAVGELERVRLSYSVDRQGQLAVRDIDQFPAAREGIVLDDIKHNVLAFGLKIKKRTDPLPAECKPTKVDCVRTAGPYTWSCAGKLDESLYDCTAIEEPADEHFKDNFLCLRKNGPSGAAFRWSYSGPIAGMSCTQVYERAEPANHTWEDNYICTRTSSTGLGSSVRFKWSEAGPLPDRECLQWLEPDDPHTWDDNYLCW